MPTLFEQLQQGLQSPTVGLAAGLLRGADAGQSFGSGLSLGTQLQNNIMRANTAVGALEQRRMEFRQAVQERNRRQQQQAVIAAQFRNPEGVAPTSAQINSLSLANTGQGNFGEILAEQTRKGPLSVTNVTVGQGSSRFLSADEKQSQGLPISDVVVENAKGDIKILKSGEKVDAGIQKIGQVDDALVTYKGLLKEFGPTIIPGEDKFKLTSAYTNLLLEAKELFNLGVLSGPDVELLQSVIKDPSSMEAQFFNGDDLVKQLNVFEQKIRQAKERFNKSNPGSFNIDESPANDIDLKRSRRAELIRKAQEQ